MCALPPSGIYDTIRQTAVTRYNFSLKNIDSRILPAGNLFFTEGYNSFRRRFFSDFSVNFNEHFTDLYRFFRNVRRQARQKTGAAVKAPPVSAIKLFLFYLTLYLILSYPILSYLSISETLPVDLCSLIIPSISARSVLNRSPGMVFFRALTALPYSNAFLQSPSWASSPYSTPEI